MITKADLNAAIAECQGKKNPDAKTCIMLAAFYTIQREMFGEEKEAEQSYSYAPAPNRNTIMIESDSEFARVVNGMEMKDFLPIIEELMETLQIMQPRLYNAVLDKLA